jgi:hypothetical protein
MKKIRVLNRINLFKIRDLVRGLNPLYISICAALLLDLKSNIKFDKASILYFLGLIFFIIACILSNALSNRCNNYGRLYDIIFNDYQKNIQNNSVLPKRALIYENGEKEFNGKKRFFQYYGVFIFGILGLIFVIFSYFSLKKQSQMIENQNKMFQHQVDSLKSIYIRYVGQISKLKQTNDSIEVRLAKYILDLDKINLQNRQQEKSDSINNQK